jgi:hypothetical protein
MGLLRLVPTHLTVINMMNYSHAYLMISCTYLFFCDFICQVTHSMQVPLSYADAVIGSAGASISYIRRHSGATISIQEGAPGEMTVEITGSASQVQTAQQLIKVLFLLMKVYQQFG